MGASFRVRYCEVHSGEGSYGVCVLQKQFEARTVLEARTEYNVYYTARATSRSHN